MAIVKNTEHMADLKVYPTIPVTKHLGQTLFLVWSNDSNWLEINFEVGIDGVISEIIFLQHWVIDFVTSLFYVLLNQFTINHPAFSSSG